MANISRLPGRWACAYVSIGNETFSTSHQLIVRKVSFCTVAKRRRNHGHRFHRRQPVHGAAVVRSRAAVHHQGRRPVCGRGQLDRRGLGHSQVHHRRNSGQLCHHHARNAGVRLCRSAGQRGHRRGQRGGLGDGQRGADHVRGADLHGVRHDAQAVWRQGLPAAGGHPGAVRLHARRSAERAGKRADSGNLRRLPG